MTRRFTVSSTKYNPGTKEESDGITVRVYLSPYDIPEAVESNHDKESNSIQIDFRYPANQIERMSPIELDESQGPVHLFVGKKTKRLMRIEVDLNESKRGQLDIRLEPPLGGLIADALDRLQRSQRGEPQHNYDIAKRVFMDRQSDLLQGCNS